MCENLRSPRADIGCLRRALSIYSEKRIGSDDSTAPQCAREVLPPLPIRLRSPSFTNRTTSSAPRRRLHRHPLVNPTNTRHCMSFLHDRYNRSYPLGRRYKPSYIERVDAMTSHVSAILATVCVVLLYCLAGLVVKSRWGGTWFVNPLKITAHISGRASLSRTQVFAFTLVFAWISVFWLLKTGQLLSIDDTVLALLGIAVAGAGMGRVADTTRFRVSGENWAWAIDKGWILRDFTRAAAGTTPQPRDLFTSDQGFEVARFQAVAFSLIVSIALLYQGATAETIEAFGAYTIDGPYLTLIGISQGVYVGGKLTGGNLFGDLDKKLSELRSLEQVFNRVVANSADWRRAAPEERNLEFARERLAPAEYCNYMAEATVAIAMVHELTGIVIQPGRIEPRLPQ